MTSDTAHSLAVMLAKLHDEDADRLKGLICASCGLSEAILSEAEDAGGPSPAVLGLRQVVTDAEGLIVDVIEKIDDAHKLALGERT